MSINAEIEPTRFWRWGYARSFAATFLLGMLVGKVLDVDAQRAGSWDQGVETWVRSVRPDHPWLTRVATVVTHLGNLEVTAPLLTAIVAGMVLLRKRGWSRIDAQEAPFWILVAVGGQILNWGLKLWFQRIRPAVEGRLVDATFYSFPSGHGMFAGVSWTLAVFVILRVWSEHSRTRIAGGIILSACLAVAVALSRIWLGVHYLSDVVAGFSLGVMWAFLCHGVRFGWSVGSKTA